MRIRFGLHWLIENGRAIDGYAFMDAPRYFDEALGIDLLARAELSEAVPPACPSAAQTTTAFKKMLLVQHDEPHAATTTDALSQQPSQPLVWRDGDAREC